MATIILGAAGAALGGAVGGTAFGLSSAVIGRAIGASIGRSLDQQLLGGGAGAVETGRVDRFRLTGASEGAPISHIYGQMRVAGQVIWATRFKEEVTTSGGGKGGPPKPTVRDYSYSVSLAIALCEGPIGRIGRVWADGQVVERGNLNMRVYRGTEDQLPDPKIEATEGTGNAPAYRGIAYVVLEDLDLGQFGNRVPQLSFEVLRPDLDEQHPETTRALGVQGVALVPGTGEYGLATTPVHYQDGLGHNRTANVNSPGTRTDFQKSLDDLSDEIPGCRAASLIVSWFGDNLRCADCTLKPKVEQVDVEGFGMPWNVSGQSRPEADILPELEGKSLYGGTPTDQSVLEAIRQLKTSEKEVMFYPFILMEQLQGNSLLDPWSGEPGQPALPWRGRITTSLAPTVPGSPDGTAFAETEVAAFFGTAARTDFMVSYVDGAGHPVVGADVGNAGSAIIRIDYNGPQEWSYRRFILHYAHLCAAAGGVESFCIGSEMRALTQIRGAGNSFPAVQALQSLAADVRAILGPDVKISYAADWSEYFGYHPQDGSGDVYFHLDPLWADANIDFVGIDNYMPLSDWRDGEDHLDADWGAIYNGAYLQANILGGEGFDWYYHSPEAREAQIRTPISDGAHHEPWVFRYKDLPSWWESYHHNRVAGSRSETSTPWEPGSKPIRFTEIGCAAIDKATNQPNRFLDPKSSETGLPHFSDGTPDELIQYTYLTAVQEFWARDENNLTSAFTGLKMIDMSHSYVWAWDTRPFPYFPNNTALWSDGDNYARGHWLNGRMGARTLASVVRDICHRSGVSQIDTSDLYGYLRGYAVDGSGDARAALQPLMLSHGFDAVEREGLLRFSNRDGHQDHNINRARLSLPEDGGAPIEFSRNPTAEVAGRVRLTFVETGSDYSTKSVEAIFPDESTYSVSTSELPLALTSSEGQAIVERWLAEARIARDQVKFSLPVSNLGVGAGDTVSLLSEDGTLATYRIDHVEHSDRLLLEASRVEAGVYLGATPLEETPAVRPFTAAVPVLPVFLDLPIIRDTNAAHAPYLAISAEPWPGPVAVYSSATDSDYRLNTITEQGAVYGITESAIQRCSSGIIDGGEALRVRLGSGALQSVEWGAVLNGANLAAIGDGTGSGWEIFQFQNAALVGPGEYDLSTRLRGQLGTDAIMPDVWPAGSHFVLLDGNVNQIDMSLSERGLARHYRIGVAGRALVDPSYTHVVSAFDGVGLRPYAPAHLTVWPEDGGDLSVSWIRRTRVDGDNWNSFDVPLGEDSELYSIRVVAPDNSVVRESYSVVPNWTYSTALQAADAVTLPYRIEVRQISQSYGAGLSTSCEIA